MNPSRPFGFRATRHSLLAALLAAVYLVAVYPLPAAEEAATESRLSSVAEYLSSDELEGRGVGTGGLDVAADYLRQQFEALGLETKLFDGTPFQKFTVTTGSELGKANDVTLVGPAKDGEEQRIELKLGQDFSPLAIGGSGRFQLPLVFVGYGITGRTENYDDYADVDVKGKAVIILRHEPEQNNPHSVFNGTEHSRHAPFRAKVSNAYQHGAAAVIFCTDAEEIRRRIEATQNRWAAALDQMAEAVAEWKKLEKPTADQVAEHREKTSRLAKQIVDFEKRIAEEKDPVLKFRQAGEDSEGRDLPIIHCRREIINRIVEPAVGKDLAAIEKQMDEGPTPQSFELSDWRIVGQTEVNREKAEVKNVVAVLEGEGPLAEETIIIGAHYDHLGYGGPGSADPGKKEIHNGADDNASGAAVLLEIARQLAQREEKLPRRVVFMAFTGEERGLLGSAYYAREPLFPLEKTVAMLNMDMVGRLQDNKLIVNGIGTAKEFPAWIDEVNEGIGFHLIKKPSGFGPSDHSTFYSKNIPVLHFFTGSHKDYHRPSDDADKLNLPGMRRIAEIVAATTVRIAESIEPPTFQETKSEIVSRGGTRPYLGSIPDFSSEQQGYALAGVAKDSPAERAGMKGGDAIIRFGDSEIDNLEDIDGALRKYKAGEKVPVVVRRGDKQVKLEVILDPPR